MAHYVFKLISLFFIGLTFCVSCVAQTKGDRLRTLLAEVREDDKLVAGCEQRRVSIRLQNLAECYPKYQGIVGMVARQALCCRTTRVKRGDLVFQDR